MLSILVLNFLLVFASEQNSDEQAEVIPRYDPVSLISDGATRNAVSAAQGAAIEKRLGLPKPSCEDLTADLPFTDGNTTPFISALGTIQAYSTALRNRMPTDCLNQLLANLSTIPNPAIDRIISELATPALAFNLSPEVRYCAEPISGIEQILSLGDDFKRIRNCSPLGLGKWKTVSGRSSSRNTYNYGLIQEAPNRIRAVLNVEFTDTHDGVTPEMMLARSRSCLNSIQGSLRGPQGEELSISLLTQNELEEIPRRFRPSRTSISIAPSNARSNARAYASSINCSAILHEVLHLFGLCDEYPGESDNYPCRAVGARDSVMRNQWLTFGRAVPENLRCQCTTSECNEVLNDPQKRALVLSPTYDDIIPLDFRNSFCGYNSMVYGEFTEDSDPPVAYSATLETPNSLRITSAYRPAVTNYHLAELKCECPTNNQDCINQLTSFASPSPTIRPRSCPLPTEPLSSTIGQAPLPDQFSNGILQFHRPATRPSLLEPYHFNRIMAGNCTERTRSYTECEAFAYETNIERCERMPDRCLRTTDWGNQ